MNLITPGSTCRTSTSKTAVIWEIQHITTKGYDERYAYLSKLGGDGFVNKTVKVTDLIDVQEQILPVGLYEVLGLRERITILTGTVKDKARFINKADEVYGHAAALLELSQKLVDANQAYWAGIEEHFPHLAPTKEN